MGCSSSALNKAGDSSRFRTGRCCDRGCCGLRAPLRSRLTAHLSPRDRTRNQALAYRVADVIAGAGGKSLMSIAGIFP
ncbi:hypothetical protein TREES_T100013414 [Tupaia chinensis]|uniref:Uncharacterized protein n=1 Tax=Tupaia chinensis TaxID=246437 RepID=L9JEM6_TUPCH|nr:hypothetical protein TREES_T100013414 [Tupaia chinensis]